MNNKKSESLAINKIIIIILIVLVITLFVFFAYRKELWDYIRNLPGYTVQQNDSEIDYTKMTPDQLTHYNCKQVGNIYYLSGVGSSYYLMIGEVKTKLYFNRDNIQLDLGNINSFENRMGFGDVILVGSLINNAIKIDSKFLNENSQDYLSYKSLLPSVAQLKILDGAFRLGENLLCKTEEQHQILKKEASCVESCKIHNGICKEIGNEDEISLGKIDCNSNLQCFVKKNEEKTVDGDLTLIDFFSVYVNPKINPPGFSFLGKDSLDVEIGERQIISFSTYYPNERTEMSAKSFCYEIRTNNQILKLGYNSNELNNGESTTSYATFNNNEKTFEVVVWDSSTNPVVFVLKRIEIKPKINPDFLGLNLLSNQKFKEEILKASEGKFYVVDAPYKFENDMVISTYKIDKYSDKIEIYGYYSTGKESKDNWYAIDCYTGFIGFISIGINLDKMENSLVETMVKNKCKIKYT